jgi:hypothetical protein
MTLLHWLEGTDSNDIFKNPYFFCENGHNLAWGEAAAEIGRVLHQDGILESAETKSIPKDSYNDVFGAEFTDVVLGSNSMSRAIRLRKLGWQPEEKETVSSLREDELPIILQDTTPFAGYGKVAAS